MHDLSLTKASSEERANVIATLVLAFAGDPVERWLYPEPGHYLESFPTFLDAFGGRAFDEGTVWRSGDFGAVAMWLPPGAEQDGQAIVDLLAASVPRHKHEDMYLALEQMDEAHPRFPHWYLPWLGVDPSVQGQGLGSRLLRHCLRFVDETKQPAYLETPNPRTIPFYERHGFEVTGATQAGRCPPITFMSRRASAKAS